MAPAPYRSIFFDGTWSYLRGLKETVRHWEHLYKIGRINNKLGIRYWTWKEGFAFLITLKKIINATLLLMHHFPDESILKLMLHHLYVLLLGFIISFLGQLPLGNMNLTATQLSVQENLRNAWKYGLGIVLVEIIYLRLALTGMDWVVEHKQLFTIIGWLTIFVFMVLGVLAFVMARKQTSAKKGLLLNNKMNRFLLGVVVSGINPAQIPFWFLWSTELLNSKVLMQQQGNLICLQQEPGLVHWQDLHFIYTAVNCSSRN
jgi:hypothetical protein